MIKSVMKKESSNLSKSINTTINEWIERKGKEAPDRLSELYRQRPNIQVKRKKTTILIDENTLKRLKEIEEAINNEHYEYIIHFAEDTPNLSLKQWFNILINEAKINEMPHGKTSIIPMSHIIELILRIRINNM
jgi:5'-deoxynucleotidase YfbR-like HD superfamily hydrolase